MRRIALALCLTCAAPALAADAAVAYPKGFRAWKHVKSMVINKGHPLYEAVGGIHHIYANPAALKGYQDRKWADGSVIVFDLFEAVDKDNAVSEGPRKAVVVMQRGARKFRATDGWGYQVFDAKTRKGALDAKAAADCAACHHAQKAHGYVFSELRD
jgi:hypothetical protein